MNKGIREFFRKATETGVSPAQVPLLATGIELALQDPQFKAHVAGLRIGELLRGYLSEQGWTDEQIAAITEEDLMWMLRDVEKEGMTAHD